MVQRQILQSAEQLYGYTQSVTEGYDIIMYQLLQFFQGGWSEVALAKVHE